MIKIFLSFVVFSMVSVCVIAEEDPFVVQMQVNSTKNNIDALKGENSSLQAEITSLEEQLKKKKTGMGLAIGAGVLGAGFGAFGIVKGVKAKNNHKTKTDEFNGLEIGKGKPSETSEKKK